MSARKAADNEKLVIAFEVLTDKESLEYKGEVSDDEVLSKLGPIDPDWGVEITNEEKPKG